MIVEYDRNLIAMLSFADQEKLSDVLWYLMAKVN